MKTVAAGLLLLSLSAVEPAGIEAAKRFAAPEIVIIHGGTLQQRVVIADWNENHKLMMGLDPQARIADSALTDRPFFEVAFFWGSDWKNHSTAPDRLHPTQGNQFGRLYPAVGSAPALFVFRAGLAGTVPSMPYRSVNKEALDLLARHGLNLRLGGR